VTWHDHSTFTIQHVTFREWHPSTLIFHGATEGTAELAGGGKTQFIHKTLLLQFSQNGADVTIAQDAQKDRPARPQRLKQAEVEVEVKVKRRTASCLLNLSLSLNLPK
jgi:hypothetical protein